MIVTRNLTPDEATGLGAWTDEEIIAAISQGKSHDGRDLHPIMPSAHYNNMALSDLQSIVAYLRSIPAVENEIAAPDALIPPRDLPPVDESKEVPDPEDAAANGEYLMRGVLPCTDCHTPIDFETGAPMFDLFLGGGQPFEGPWGIVYGGNITPDEETGLGSW